MVAAITPWNYSVQLLSRKVSAALVVECALVAKPPSYTPISPIMFMECLVEAGIPKGVINILTGPSRTVGEALVTHPLVRKVSLTRSTDVGKSVMKLCANGLKRVTLELRGQTPIMVRKAVEVVRNLNAQTMVLVCSTKKSLGNCDLHLEGLAGLYNADERWVWKDEDYERYLKAL